MPFPVDATVTLACFLHDPMASNPFDFLDIDANRPDPRGSRRPRLSWVEESFIFETRVGRQVPLAESDKFLGSSFTLRRSRALLLFMAIGFCLLFVRVAYIQLWRGSAYRSIAEGNRQQVAPIPAERGLIYDRSGKLLTRNIPKFSLALIPQHLPRDSGSSEAIIAKLAALTNRSADEIRNLITEYGSYSFESIIIQDDLDYATALSIQIAAADLPGITIVRGSKRLYGDASAGVTSTPVLSLSHILGYEGKLGHAELDQLYSVGYLPSDVIGKAGLEKTYETILRGRYGKKRIEVNAFGREQTVLAEVPPAPGVYLHLSLDLAAQQELEALLRQTLKATRRTHAAAVALDPRSGEVIALVSLPAFDNNDFSGGIDRDQYQKYLADPDQPLFNRAISGLYPSGSTVKPALAAAALQEGVITPHTTVLSTGGLQVGPSFFSDWLAGGHGSTDVRKSLAQSVNTFYYYIGGGYRNFVGLGIDRMAAYLGSFGFSHLSGIDLPGEASGFVPSKQWKEKAKGERWYVGDSYNLAIGQGDFLVTPLQIAVMTVAIANGGTVYQPHLIQMTVDPVSGNVHRIAPTIMRQNFIQPSNLAVVRQGMRDCVTGGSCRRLSSLPMPVAGKTGTAQWNHGRLPHGWFTSFSPYDKPEIVLTILVEEGGEGSAVSVPVAEQFYRWWFANHKS